MKTQKHKTKLQKKNKKKKTRTRLTAARPNLGINAKNLLSNQNQMVIEKGRLVELNGFEILLP